MNSSFVPHKDGARVRGAITDAGKCWLLSCCFARVTGVQVTTKVRGLKQRPSGTTSLVRSGSDGFFAGGWKSTTLILQRRKKVGLPSRDMEESNERRKNSTTATRFQGSLPSYGQYCGGRLGPGSNGFLSILRCSLCYGKRRLHVEASGLANKSLGRAKADSCAVLCVECRSSAACQNSC